MEYRFIIDTKQYAGNFKCHLCAWLTGCVGDDNVGLDMSQRALGFPPYAASAMSDALEQWCSDHIGQFIGQWVSRPVSIWLPPDGGLKATSVAIAFTEEPPLPIRIELMDRARTFAAEFHANGAFMADPCARSFSKGPGITITGFRVVHEETVLTTLFTG